jgi:hypothetical protein
MGKTPKGICETHAMARAAEGIRLKCVFRPIRGEPNAIPSPTVGGGLVYSLLTP